MIYSDTHEKRESRRVDDDFEEPDLLAVLDRFLAGASDNHSPKARVELMPTNEYFMYG